MKREYDFANAKKNPYAKLLKKKILINISKEVLDYFKKMSKETSMPYKALINFYLLDCVNSNKRIVIDLETKNKDY